MQDDERSQHVIIQMPPNTIPDPNLKAAGAKRAALRPAEREFGILKAAGAKQAALRPAGGV